MNDSTSPQDPAGGATREEILAALFANMVIQQTNMAMMLLGKVAHPETGQFIQDVEAAKMFIDQLEMIEVKTKGNLSRQEEGLLKQALTSLRMAFVEAIDVRDSENPADQIAPPAASSEHAEPPSSASEKPANPPPASAPPPSSPPPAEESRKKFTKKY